MLASLIEQRLRQPAFPPASGKGLGSSVIFDALAAGEIDAYVDYSGTLWANQMRRTDTQPRDVVLREVADWLKRERGIVMLGALGFENAYALGAAAKARHQFYRRARRPRAADAHRRRL